MFLGEDHEDGRSQHRGQSEQRGRPEHHHRRSGGEQRHHAPRRLTDPECRRVDVEPGPIQSNGELLSNAERCAHPSSPAFEAGSDHLAERRSRPVPSRWSAAPHVGRESVDQSGAPEPWRVAEDQAGAEGSSEPEGDEGGRSHRSNTRSASGRRMTRPAHHQHAAISRRPIATST